MEPQEIELLARAAHEMNRLYCIGIGDQSQKSWEDSPDWQRDSAKNGVRGALAGNTPQQSHESWLEEKKATGWKWGPVKDAVLKEHPCMVDYADLPPEQQAKDEVFTTTVRTLAQALGLMKRPEPAKASDVEDIRKKLLEHASLALSCRKYGDAVMLLDMHQRLSFGWSSLPAGLDSGASNATGVPDPRG